ncbi:MAG: Curved DNA-binding protein [Phycisphaerae bacterium]|nr:Curved DNA-binding protein [Phycisphaerae bacterium]
MNSRKDPYQILGVDRSADAEQIKRAYRKLAKQYHPDRNPDDKTAEERFKQVQAAYEVLGDERRRRQYDQFGAGGPPPDINGWEPHFDSRNGNFTVSDFGDLSSIFEQFFTRGGAGGGTRRASVRRGGRVGEDVRHTVELTFEEGVRGTTREVELQIEGESPERLKFRIPAGVEDGQRIRLRGKGQEGRGGRGDLIIECRILPHAYFRREGLNVLLDLPLSVKEAVLGARVDVPTLDGPTTLIVPPGTSSGSKLRLRGKGIASNRTGETGDMIAVVKIMIPRNGSENASRLVEALDREWRFDPRAQAGWRLT